MDQKWKKCLNCSAVYELDEIICPSCRKDDAKFALISFNEAFKENPGNIWIKKWPEVLWSTPQH